MFSSTINEFLDREGVSVYSEKRLGKKHTRLGSLDSALLGMRFTPAVMFPGLKWNCQRVYAKHIGQFFWHIMSIYL